MKKSEVNLTKVFQAIAQEGQDKPFVIRLTPTERDMLGFVAKAYSLNMAEVMRRLLHQAVIDYVRDDEVMALLSYQYVQEIK